MDILINMLRKSTSQSIKINTEIKTNIRTGIRNIETKRNTRTKTSRAQVER